VKFLVICLIALPALPVASQASLEVKQLLALYQEGRDSATAWLDKKYYFIPQLPDSELDKDYRPSIQGTRILSPDSLIVRNFGEPRYVKSHPEYSESDSRTYYYDDVVISTEFKRVQSMALLTSKYKNGHGVHVGMPMSQVLKLYRIDRLSNMLNGALFVSRISEIMILYKTGTVWQIVYTNQH